MKRDKIDEILSVIDTGLQSTAEASYGETPGDGANVGDPTCIRCDRDLDPDTGEICPACRAYLLGDTSDDPADNGLHNPGWVEVTVWIGADPIPCEEAFARFRSITPTEETDRATPPPPEDPPT